MDSRKSCSPAALLQPEPEIPASRIPCIGDRRVDRTAYLAMPNVDSDAIFGDRIDQDCISRDFGISQRCCLPVYGYVHAYDGEVILVEKIAQRFDSASRILRRIAAQVHPGIIESSPPRRRIIRALTDEIQEDMSDFIPNAAEQGVTPEKVVRSARRNVLDQMQIESKLSNVRNVATRFSSSLHARHTEVIGKIHKKPKRKLSRGAAYVRITCCIANFCGIWEADQCTKNERNELMLILWIAAVCIYPVDWVVLSVGIPI